METTCKSQDVNESDLIYGCEDVTLEIAENIYRQRRAEQIIKKKGLEKTVLKKHRKKKRIPGRDFHIPKYAYELKDWITNYCEKSDKPFPKNFSKMRKKQLYAVYFSIMAN